MPAINEAIECGYCSESIPTNSYQCSHCSIQFCHQCVVQHYTHIKNEFMEMINRINGILARFLHHAHSQTEWTNHLTEDRKRLEIFVRLIETFDTRTVAVILPKSQWVNHVNNLIDKYSFAINENCCPLMYPCLNSSSTQ